MIIFNSAKAPLNKNGSKLLQHTIEFFKEYIKIIVRTTARIDVLKCHSESTCFFEDVANIVRGSSSCS